MSFLSINSACFLLIITIAFSSSCGGVEAQFGTAATNFIKNAAPIFSRTGNKVSPAVKNVAGNKVAPAVKNVAAGGLQNVGEQALKTYGENLAGKLFGPAGKKGFRWGWNGSKYYFKAANKCEGYQQRLIASYCPQQSPDPLPTLPPTPDCVAQCAIEYAYFLKDGTPVECISRNVNGCYYHAAEEAKCDNTSLNTQKNCTLINLSVMKDN